MPSTKKPRLRLQTIPEFLALRPHINRHALRYALRHRHKNGLAEHTYRRATGKHDILLDPKPWAAYLAADRVVPA